VADEPAKPPPDDESPSKGDGGEVTTETLDERQSASFFAGEWLPTVKVTAAAFALALLIGAVLIILSDSTVLDNWTYFFDDPWTAISSSFQAVKDSYWALLEGSLGSGTAIKTTLERSAPLICAGLSVTLAFRAGLFNIGAQGQLLIGAIFAAYVGFHYDLPTVVHLIAALLAGLLGGAIWGGIVGLLKARTGAHEVIVTIMMNYIAVSILTWLLTKEAFQEPGSNNPRSEKVADNARFPEIFGVHSGVILAVVAAVVVWWLLERTTLGFELRAVGANADAARTAGMSVPRTYLLAMVIAGALAGLAGSQQVQGHQDALTGSFGGTIGFDGITVALLGRATPVGTVFAGLLFGALSAGGLQMQAASGTPLALTQLLQAIIVLFVAAPALVKTVFRIRDTGAEGAVLAKGWSS
jgi:simple sugar transport system permease protein